MPAHPATTSTPTEFHISARTNPPGIASGSISLVPQPPRFAHEAFVIGLAIFLHEFDGLALRDPILKGEEFDLKSPFDFVPTPRLMAGFAQIICHAMLPCTGTLPLKGDFVA
jgi:hypothetical protein